MIDVSLVDALVSALERKASALRIEAELMGVTGEAITIGAIADWIEELIEQFQQGEIDS